MIHGAIFSVLMAILWWGFGLFWVIKSCIEWLGSHV